MFGFWNNPVSQSIMTLKNVALCLGFLLVSGISLHVWNPCSDSSAKEELDKSVVDTEKLPERSSSLDSTDTEKRLRPLTDEIRAQENALGRTPKSAPRSAQEDSPGRDKVQSEHKQDPQQIAAEESDTNISLEADAVEPNEDPIPFPTVGESDQHAQYKLARAGPGEVTRHRRTRNVQITGSDLTKIVAGKSDDAELDPLPLALIKEASEISNPMRTSQEPGLDDEVYEGQCAGNVRTGIFSFCDKGSRCTNCSSDDHRHSIEAHCKECGYPWIKIESKNDGVYSNQDGSTPPMESHQKLEEQQKDEKISDAIIDEFKLFDMNLNSTWSKEDVKDYLFRVKRDIDYCGGVRIQTYWKRKLRSHKLRKSRLVAVDWLLN